MPARTEPPPSPAPECSRLAGAARPPLPSTHGRFCRREWPDPGLVLVSASGTSGGMLGSLGRWLRALQRRLRLRKRWTRAVSDCLRSCPAWRKVRNHEPSFRWSCWCSCGSVCDHRGKLCQEREPEEEEGQRSEEKKAGAAAAGPHHLAGRPKQRQRRRRHGKEEAAPRQHSRDAGTRRQGSR